MTKKPETVTILKCRSANTKANKKFEALKDGTIRKISFSAGRYFNYEIKEISNLDDLHELFLKLSKEPIKFIIRGKPKPNAKATARRKIHPPDAAFDPEPRYWVVLDIDKLRCPEHMDPAKNPKEAVQWALEALPPPFRKVRCIHKFSSSQNVPGEVGKDPEPNISLHLGFWCNRKVSDAEWKRYFKANPSPVDTSLFSAVHIHYIADPEFIGFDDPLPQRIGILENDLHVIEVPLTPKEKPKKRTERQDRQPKLKKGNREKALEMLLAYYEEGSRNMLCTSIAGALYRGGWKAENVADFIHELAENAEDEEIMSRHESALRICEAVDNGRPAQGIATLRNDFEIEELDEILTLLDIGKPDVTGAIEKLSNKSTPAEIDVVLKMLVELPVSEREFLLDEIKDKTTKNKSSINKAFKEMLKEHENQNSEDVVVGIVNDLLENSFEDGRCLIRAADGNFWQYNGRHWEIMPPDLLKKRLLPLAKQHAESNFDVSRMLDNSINLLKGQVFGEGDPLRLTNSPPTVVNCKNGELWFDKSANITFKPHRPESYLRNCLNVDYSPGATSPEFDKAVLEIFAKTKNPQANFDHFMEFVGYVCQPWRKIPLIVLLHGAGSNGKTSLMKIVEKLLGSQAIMSDRISDIEKYPFKIGALADKLLLLDDDVDAGTCLPDGFLKKISEQKMLTGQHKHKNPFQFICLAVPVMLANSYPALKDLSYGVRRRMMVVPFLRTFRKKDIKTDLFDEIWETEASGILNHAVMGFQRLKRRGHFQETEECTTAKNEWLVRSNVFVTFIEEECEKGEKLNQSITEFYKYFQNYCKNTGIRNTLSLQGVKARLENMGYDITILDGRNVVRGLKAPEILQEF